MSQIGISSNRSSRSVSDFTSATALRDALESMDSSSSKNTTAGPEMSSSTAATPIGLTVNPPKMNVDPVVVDTVAEAMINGDNNTTSPGSTTLPSLGSLSPPTPSWLGTDNDQEKAKERIQKELRRLAVLKSYRVLQTSGGRNPAYERLISLTARIFKVPIAYISVIDLTQQHFLASRGLGVGSTTVDDETPRETSICAHVMDSDADIFVVPDLTVDPTFHNHPFVVGSPHVRFYSSAPLVCPEGFRLGTLCILDTEPRNEGLSLKQKQNLREIASMVIDVFVEERERKNFDYRQPSQMIACTSNDLLTPLAGLEAGLTEICNDEPLFSTLTQQQKEIFQTTIACSSVMKKICTRSLQQIMDAMKNERDTTTNGDLEVSEAGQTNNDTPDMLRIREIVNQLQIVMEPIAKQVPLVITVDDDIPPVIISDELKVFRSIVNLLTNACAVCTTGSVHLKIFLRNPNNGDMNDKNDQSVMFLVEDTGPDIPVEQYPQHFKPISNDHEDTSCKLASYGQETDAASNGSFKKDFLMSLYSVATLISSLGGDYGFRPRGVTESGSGQNLKGSIFWFSVPLVLPQQNNDLRQNATRSPSEGKEVVKDSKTESNGNTPDVPSQAKRKRDSISSPSERTKRALIIEDSIVTRRTLSRILNSLGFQVTEAVNGLDGLRKLQSSLFDLTLCDFLMPIMDGPDCIQQYRQYEVSSRPFFDQYIVGISCHASEADIERGIKVGMNDFKPKPITVNSVQEIMASEEYQYVSSRLENLANDLADASTSGDEKRHQTGSAGEKSNEKEQYVCLIVEADKGVASFAEQVAENVGWKAVIVDSEEAAIRLLQIRNWDAVLLDDGLSSCSVLEHFRDFENSNRVRRQNNVYQMSSSFIPSKLEASSTTVQLPSGFDGAIGKPVSQSVFRDFLLKSAQTTSSTSKDIVSR